MAITKYAVYNPNSGTHDFYDTQEAALQAFWGLVVSFAVKYHFNTPYMVVEQNEDGSEIWRNDGNKEIQRPITEAEIKARIELYRQKIQAPEQTNNT